MKICLVCEGSYPYVTGGVSSWVQMLMKSMPKTEFCVVAIAADRAHGGLFKYQMPDNLTAVHEVYLQDADYTRAKKPRLRLSKRQTEALRSFFLGEQVDWPAIFDFFDKDDVSVNALLLSPEFFDIIQEYYDSRYQRLPFTDFLWTCRSMLLPLCVLLKNRMPPADIYHTQSSGYAGLLACMAKYVYQKPAILTEHGIYTREREEEIIRSSLFEGAYKDLWIRHFYKLSDCAYRYADRVISLFPQARGLQLELGCDPLKAMVIPNGVIPERFDHSQVKKETDFRIRRRAKAILSLSEQHKMLHWIFNYLIEKLGYTDIKNLIKQQKYIWLGGKSLLNLDKPKTFAEKILWLCDNVYDKDPRIVEISDKYTFKDYVRKQLGEGFTTTLLGVYNSAKEVDFDKLPKKFVLKSTWGGEGKQVMVVKDKSKLDIAACRATMSLWLLPWADAYYPSFNNTFKDIKPCIIAEELIETEHDQLDDYKFFCFHGVPMYLYATREKSSRYIITMYDMDWKRQNVQYCTYNPGDIEKPKFFNEMKELAAKLSAPFPFVRVDFYETSSKIYLGEMTFTSHGGYATFDPPEWDEKLGALIKLPTDN